MKYSAIMKIRVALIDDHPLLIKGLKTTLGNFSHIELIGTFTNERDLLVGLVSSPPDVLLLDIQMPGMSGDELMPIIQKKHPDLGVIVLTNFDSVLYANSMFKLGALGYILKTTNESTLIKAIETVFKKEKFIEPNMKDRMHQIAHKIKRAVTSKISITPREKEVLQLLVDGATTTETAQKLFLSAGTIENYRNTLLLKLEAKNTAVLVKKALQLGLVKL